MEKTHWASRTFLQIDSTYFPWVYINFPHVKKVSLLNGNNHC